MASWSSGGKDSAMLASLVLMPLCHGSPVIAQSRSPSFAPTPTWRVPPSRGWWKASCDKCRGGRSKRASRI